jgi:hypothetical protein
MNNYVIQFFIYLMRMHIRYGTFSLHRKKRHEN